MRIDLHSHSRHSDGRLEAAELVRAAVRAGLTHLALTDHDTVSGLAEAARAARAAGLELVCGIEISASFDGREIHVLGHGLVPTAPALVRLGERMAGERVERMGRMIDRLAAHGVSVTLDEVRAESGGRTLGRPHLARVLVRKGLVDHVGEAFARWLSPGRPGWADRARPTAPEAIRLVHEAGGTASVAHPGVDRISRAELAALAAAGLDAVEAFHPDHEDNQADAYVRWGREARLEATGGSDFHAENESHPLGTCTTPPASWAALRERAAARRAQPALAAALAAWEDALQGAGGAAGA